MATHAQGMDQKRRQHYIYPSGSSSAQRWPVTKNNKPTANTSKAGECDFQSYHIMKIKCPDFNKESEDIQRNSKVWPIPRENIIQQNLSLKKMAKESKVLK